MYTASFLSILALLATTTLSAPIARPDGGAVYVTDNVVVYVTVTAGQEAAKIPAATSSPVAAPVQQANGKLQIANAVPAPAAPVTTSSKAAPVSTSQAAPSSTSSAVVAGGAFVQVQSVHSISKPSTAATTSTAAAPSNAAPSGMNIQSTNGDAVTIYIQNNFGKNVDYGHTNSVGSPNPVGNPTSGTIANGEMYSFTIGQDWGGNIAFTESGKGAFTYGNTLLEGSWANQVGYGGYKVDMDVSFVDGFSVPLTCTYAATQTKLGGCSTNLWNQNGISCPQISGGACVNAAGPLKTTLNLDQVDPFFHACGTSGAYVYWKDDSQGNPGNGKYEGTISCTIG